MRSSYYKTKSKFFDFQSQDESPILKLIEIARINDAAAMDMRKESLGLALGGLKIARSMLSNMGPQERHELAQKADITSFARIFKTHGSFPSLLQLDFIYDKDGPDKKLFSSAIRVGPSRLPATAEALSAVVSFNLGLAYQARATKSSEATTATAFLSLARQNYIKAVFQGSPPLVRAAAYCNLVECATNDDEQSTFQEKLADALVNLDDPNHLAIFQLLILLPAAAA